MSISKKEFVELQKKTGFEYPCQHCGEKEAVMTNDSVDGYVRSAWCNDCEIEYMKKKWRIDDMYKKLNEEFEKNKYKWWEDES